MFRTILLSFGLFLPCFLSAQCEVQAFIYEDTLVCGQCVTLFAAGEGQGQQVFGETFNNGQPTGWAYTNQAMFNNPCDPNGVDGTIHIWMGNNTGVPRILETVPFDFSQAAAGVTVCFDLLFAPQTGDAADAPCEGPDEPNEGVNLQYSIDGGNTWVDIFYFDPNGGADPQLINWNNWCFTLPPAALTASTIIRWFQDNDSGADYDHWGLDNVEIYYNDPTYQLIWQHDNYLHPPGEFAGFNPTQVCPQTTTTYYVGMINANYFCTDSVVVYVRNPTVRINAGLDTSVCPGECVALDANADILVSPAKTPTYSNGEIQPIANAFGSETAIGINITDLNMATVLPNAITSVCIDQLFYFGFQFPNGQSDISDLNIYLECPDGTRIVLVPAGVTTGANNPITGGYLNTCFVPAGPPIGGGTAPYTGAWAPNQPFNDLVGCTANGLWQLVVESNVLFGFGAGTFFGWSISFDDPEISYPANFTWSPTATLSDPLVLNPVACPVATTDYVLMASDTAGCVTASDTVRVSVGPNCCPLWFVPTVAAPSCAGNNGSINLALGGGSGSYAYLWDNGATTASLNGLNDGTFSVTVTDLIQNCSIDTVFLFTAPSFPLANLLPTDATCSNLAALDLTVTGGSGSFTFAWATGQSTEDLGALAPGLYTVTVTDQNGGCTVSATSSVVQSETELLLEIIANNDTDCGPTCNGFVTVSLQNGLAPFVFAWDNGATTGILANLCGGVYNTTVTNGFGCSATASVTVEEALPPTLSLTPNGPVNFCDGGFVSLNATAAGATFVWSPPQGGAPTGPDLQAQDSGLYAVTATNAAGCTASASVSVTEYTAVVASAASNTPLCLGENLTLQANGPAGSTFAWSGPAGFVGTNATENLTNVQAANAGDYQITVTDANGCSGTASIAVSIIDLEVSIANGATDSVSAGEQIILAASSPSDPNVTYTWTTVAGFLQNGASVSVSPTTTTVYTVNGILGNCSDSDSIWVYVRNGAYALPNAFTPNSDGKNDLFFPLISGDVEVLDFRVFNRWGQTIHEKTMPWDGTFKDSEQPRDVYFYRLQVRTAEGATESVVGEVLLVR